MFEKRLNIGNKKAQVTIFIIIGVIIVAGAILVVSFFPQIRNALTGQEQTPQNYIQTCVKKGLEEAVEKVSLQGGSMNPEYYSLHSGVKVQYLCYTNENYKMCNLQKPGFKKLVETEIRDEIDEEVTNCFNAMVDSYRRKGYVPELTDGEKEVEILPDGISSRFGYKLTLTKGEDTQEHDSFVVMINSNLYQFVGIADGIAKLESEFGDVEPTWYMEFYPYLRVYRQGKSDGTKIYIIEHKDTNEKFMFSIRSLVFPSGYV